MCVVCVAVSYTTNHVLIQGGKGSLWGVGSSDKSGIVYTQSKNELCASSCCEK